MTEKKRKLHCTKYDILVANYRKEGTRTRTNIIIIAVKTLRNYSNFYGFLQLFYRTVCM